MLGLPAYRREEIRMKEETMEFLQELGLAHLALEKAVALPYGKQRRLEIARPLLSGQASLAG